jgi:hypothetical protein
MSDGTSKRSVRLFAETGRDTIREPRRGVWQVWLTIAIILVIEVAATVWFIRTYARAPQPGAGQNAAVATPAPAR